MKTISEGRINMPSGEKSFERENNMSEQ